MTGLGLLVAATGPVRAAQPQTLAYWVRRDGTPIGEHRIAFAPTPAGGQEVRFTTDIAVKIAFITAFRFTHRATETWDGDGRLLALDSHTDDDGTEHRVQAAAGSGGLTVETGQGTRVLPADTLVHDHWNPANRRRDSLLSIYDGTTLAVSFTDAGSETVTVNDQSVTARRFEATGDLTRRFWFDDTDRLVKVGFESRGSAVTYELRTSA